MCVWGMCVWMCESFFCLYGCMCGSVCGCGCGCVGLGACMGVGVVACVVHM